MTVKRFGMMWAWLLILVSFMPVSLLRAADGDTLILAENRQARYVVICGGTEGPVVGFAAQELATYLQRMSGASFAVQEDTSSVLPRIVVGMKNPLAEKNIEMLAVDSIVADGFRIITIGEDLYITGAMDRGTLYGVYHLLDNDLGVRWYAPDFEVVPFYDTMGVKRGNDLQNPAMIYREMFNHDTDDPYYRQHNRLNGSRMHRSPFYNNYPDGINSWSDYCKEGPPELDNGGHNFYTVVPDEDCHHGGQLMMMSESCRQTAANTFNNAILQYGTEMWYGFSQNDVGWQPDDASRSFAEAHGGALSAPLIDMVADVAARVREQHPGAKLATSAYQWSFSPPSGMTVPHYIMVELAPIHADFGTPLTGERNAQIDADTKQWNNICHNLTIWDYVTNYQNYLQPMPTIRAMCENIQYYCDLEHVKGYMGEGTYNTGGIAFAPLRTWVASRLMWNPHQDYKKLINEFVNGYYGPAAYYIRQYLEALHNSLEQADERVAVKQRISSRYLSLDFIMLADQLLASADAVAGGVYARHVHEVRMGVDMTILLMEHVYKAEAEKRGIPWVDDPGRRQRFEQYASEAGVSSYNEDSGMDVLYKAMNIDRVAPDTPDVAVYLDKEDWIDYQDYDLQICCGAILQADYDASDHGAVLQKGDEVWSTQMDLTLLPEEGEWDLYAYVRAATKSGDNVAFHMGVFPGETRTVMVSEVQDGKYHVFQFPGGPFRYSTDKGLWFAGTPAGVYNIYIDRVVAVRHGVKGIGEKSVLSGFFLGQNMPNPCRDMTTIRYTLPVTGMAVLTVMNAQGQTVAIPVNEKQRAGDHEVRIATGTLSPGIYFYRLTAGKYSETRKMIIKR